MSRLRWTAAALGLMAGLAWAGQEPPQHRAAPVAGYAPNLPATVTRASVHAPLPPASRPNKGHVGTPIGPQAIGGPSGRRMPAAAP